MQRPNNVTPTRIPSLGAIVRLFSFTGLLRGSWAKGAIGGMIRDTIWWNPLALGYGVPVEVPDARTALFRGSRDCAGSGTGRWNRKEATPCRGHNQHRN